MITNLKHCKLFNISVKKDNRGYLSYLENKKELPFYIKRIYFLYKIKKNILRGDHGHKKLKQIIIAISGKFDVVINDGKKSKKFKLSKCSQGLYIPNMMWRKIENFSKNAICLVLASEKYNKEDYYNDFEKFKYEKYK